MKILCERRHLSFGGIHVIFVGDFFQLKPPNGAPIYEIYNSCWHDSKLGINSVIYLNSSHRFKDDQRWGDMLSRIRVGKGTQEMLDIINKRTLYHQNKERTKLEYPTSSNICYACPTNKQTNKQRAVVLRYFSII